MSTVDRARALEYELAWDASPVLDAMVFVTFRRGLTVSRVSVNWRNPIGLSFGRIGELRITGADGTVGWPMHPNQMTPTVIDFLKTAAGVYRMMQLRDIPGLIRCEIVDADGALLI